MRETTDVSQRLTFPLSICKPVFRLTTTADRIEVEPATVETRLSAETRPK